MRKRISLLTILIMGLSLFLFACKPYSDLKLSVSETNVVLYLNRVLENDSDLDDEQESDEEQEQENVDQENDENLFELGEEFPHLKTVTAVVGGAKKNTSRAVTITQTGGYVVDVENTELVEDTTTFNLVAKHPGQSIITVATREGNLKHVINVRVHERVQGLEFSKTPIALTEGVSVNLLNKINFSPSNTTQKNVSFFIDDNRPEVVVMGRDENGRIIETNYAKIENNQIIIKDINLTPQNTDTYERYVYVGAYSLASPEVVAEAKLFSVVDIVSENDISLLANNEASQIQLQKNASGQYEVVVATKSDNPNLFTRRLSFNIGEDAFSDMHYTVSIDKTFGGGNLVNVSDLTNHRNRQQAKENLQINLHEYSTFQITQNNVVGEEVVRFLVDYTNFKGQFTIPVYVKFIVKEFPSVIEIQKESGQVINEQEELQLFNKFARGVHGTKIVVNIKPGTINSAYRIIPQNAPSFIVKASNGTIISSEQQILSGQSVFLSHMETSNLPEEAMFIIETKYSLATSADTEGYIEYSKQFIVRLDYQIGLNDDDVESPNVELKIDANKKQLIRENEGPTSIIDIIWSNVSTVNIIDQIDTSNPNAIRFVRFEGREIRFIEGFNLNVFNNIYFSLDLNRDANAIRLNPKSFGSSTNFVLGIILRNGIERSVRVTMFSSLAYTNAQQVRVDAIANSDAYFNITHNGFNLSLNENNNLIVRKARVYEDGRLVSYNENGEIITDATENKTPLQVSYSTLRSINLKTNSEINLEFYNYLPEIVNGQMQEMLHNDFVNIKNNYSHDHFTITKNPQTNGITLKTKTLPTNGYLNVVVVFSGYNDSGNRITLEYPIMVRVTEPINRVYITPSYSEVYEKSTLGALSLSGSIAKLQTITQPAVSSNITKEYNLLNNTILRYELRINPELSINLDGQNIKYIDYVRNYSQTFVSHIKVQSNGLVFVEFYGSDIATLTEVGEEAFIEAEFQESVYQKIEQIYKLSRTQRLDQQLSESVKLGTEFRDVSNSVLESFYANDIRVRVISVVQHFSEEPITASAEIVIKFAVKVQNIISQDIGDEGIYFDNRQGQATREVGFYALPLNANNRTLIATINDESIARIVAGVNDAGEITGENQQGVYTGKITIQMLKAGETFLRVSAKDSYIETVVNGNIVIVPSAGSYIDYRIKSADGSEQNPFEIRTSSEFLDINNYSPNYHYVLANNINLLNTNLTPIKHFNGSLNGEFTYYKSGIYYTRYHSIIGLNISPENDIVIENSPQSNYNNYNVGMFESLGKDAKISNLFIIDASININFEKQTESQNNTEFNKYINVGVVAGSSLGVVENVTITGAININATGIPNINIGGFVGEQQSTFNTNNSAIEGWLSYNKNSEFNAFHEQQSAISIKLHSDKNLTNNTNKNLGGVVGSITVLGQESGLVQEAYELSVLSGFEFFVIIESLYGEQNNLNSANVGGVAGFSENVFINNINVLPTLRAYSNVGGIVGYAKNSSITNTSVNMFSPQLNELNKSAITATNNVGGIAGVAEGLKLNYIQVRSFINNTVGQNFYGDIVLLNSEDENTNNKQIGGLIGLVVNSGLQADLFYENGRFVEKANEEDVTNLFYERKGYTIIENSYFDGVINAGYEQINAPVYVGGLVGFAQKLNEETEFKTLSIDNSYVVGEVLPSVYLPQSETTEIWLDILPSNENQNSEFNNNYFNPIIENEQGEITQIMFGEFKFVQKADSQQFNNQIAVETINILQEFRDIEVNEQTITQFKVVINTVFDNIAGLFVGNNNILIESNLADYVGVGDVIIEEGFEYYSLYSRTNSFIVNQNHDNSILIEHSYSVVNADSVNSKLVGVVGLHNQQSENISVQVREYSFKENYVLTYSSDEKFENIIFSNNTVESENLSYTNLTPRNLIDNYSFSFGEFSVILFDEDSNLIVNNITVNEFPVLENFVADYPNAHYIMFDYSGELERWFVFEGINNGLPVLISQNRNMLLYSLLPSDIIANVLHFSDNNIAFNNTAYVNVSNNKVVLFKNNLIGRGQGTLPSNLNKYKIVRKGAPISSNNIFNVIEYDFNLNTPNNLPFQPEVKDNVSIISNNLSVVRVLTGGIIEVVNTGHATLTIRSVINPSITTTIEIMVVKGISSYRIIGDGSRLNTDVYIDQVRSYAIETENKINIQNFVGEFEKINNIGFIVTANYFNQGLIELNNIALQDGKQYVFESIREFNLKGINEGVVRFEITAFINATTPNFGVQFVGENKTINNIILLNDLLISQTNFNNLSFNIIPKASMISNNISSARISPTGITQVKVSFITSAFNYADFNEFIANNSEINTSNLQRFIRTGTLKEEISLIVKSNITGNNLFKINNILNEDSASTTFTQQERALLLYEIVGVNVSEITNSNNEIKQLKVSFDLQLSFDRDEFSNNTDLYNINQQNFMLTFSPLTNIDIFSNYNIEVVPNSINRITTTFYAANEYEAGDGGLVFNPKEVSSNYIAPGRTGLLKAYLFPEFNNAEFVELTVNDGVKDYISFEQLLEVYDGNNEYSEIIGYEKLNQFTQKLPNNKGILLKNSSLLTNRGMGRSLFNGSFFVQVSLGSNIPVGQLVQLTLTAYNTVNGVKESIKSETISLNVQPLPSVSISYQNQKEGIAIAGDRLRLDVVGYNYDDEIDVQILSSTQGAKIEVVNGVHYLVINDNANIGEEIVLRAVATKLVGGVFENSEDELRIKVVDFIINGVQLLGASSQSATVNNFEILNGTNNELSVVLNANYSQTTEFGQLVARKQYLENIIAGKQSLLPGQYINSWYYVENSENMSNLIAGTTYAETFAFRQITTTGVNVSRHYSLQGIKVSNGEHTLGVMFKYYYDDFGRVQILGLDSQENPSVHYETLLYTFRLVINDNSTYDHPNPISSAEDFYQMQEGSHYILVNDITLDNHTPFVANFASLDGNGYVINLNRFNMTSYANAQSTVTTGMFETVSANSVIKNITLNIAGLLVTNSEVQAFKDPSNTNTSKIDLRNIPDVVFGVLAGNNRGTLTNIRIVNLGNNSQGTANGTDQSNKVIDKQLFVNTTQKYVDGREMIAKIGGLVGQNSGTISNSFVGQNYHYIIEGATSQNNEVIEGQSLIKRVIKDSNNYNIEERNTYNFSVSGGKQIAGFAFENTGTIANSYLKEVGVINHSDIASNAQTGGFVLNNNGRIYGSFIEGANVKDFRASDDVYIEGKGFIGGFVYRNSGSITDSYSNITIKSNSGRSGGFVYNNQTSGIIKNAYSAGNSGARVQEEENPSVQEEENPSGQLSAHGYFTGISDLSEYNNAGNMTSVFYLLSGNDVASLHEPATPIHAGLGGGEYGNTFRLSSSFSEFNFVTPSIKNDGIWWINETNTNYGPQLINTITTNTLSVREEQESEQDSVYHYTYNAKTPYGSENNPILVNTAEEFLNSVLSNTKTYYSQNEETLGQRKYIFGEAGNQGAYIKLVNDLDFNNIVINDFVVRGIRISDVVFAGHLDGNGMAMRGISLLDLNKSEINENYGLFNQIGLTNSQFKDFTRKNLSDKNKITTIKDISIHIRQFDATQSVKVGALAGSIYDANLINISVNGSGIIITGRNLVGGVAGLIKYESSEHTITGLTVNNISVSASYSIEDIRSSDLVNDFGVAVRINGANRNELSFNSYGKDYIRTGQVTLSQLQRYSYAGGVAGVFEGFNRSDDNKEIVTSINTEEDDYNDINKYRSETISKFNNIQSVGGGVISAEQAGGLFGMIGQNSHIMNSSYIVNTTQSTTQTIIGSNYAGGIVAENYGMLEKVFVEHEQPQQENYDNAISRGTSNIMGRQDLFGTKPNVAIGGIAGFTDNSIILDSYVKVNVINAESKIAGGIAGLVSRKNYISHAFVTSGVNAKNIYGGAFGLYNNSGERLFTGTNVDNESKLVLDYIIALNTWGTANEQDLNNNLQVFYNSPNFVLRMPEIGNLLPNFANVDDVNKDLSPTFTEEYPNSEDSERYNNLIHNITSNERGYKYIGSLIGMVSLHSSSLSEDTSLNNHRVFGFSGTGAINYENLRASNSLQIFLTKSGVNTVLAEAREVELRQKVKTVVSTTINNTNTKLSSESPSNNWHTESHQNITGDIFNYDKIVGEQFKPNRIVGIDGENQNIFAQWEIDDVNSNNLMSANSSQSKRWRLPNEGAIPEFLVGVYSNYTVIDSNTKLHEVMKQTESTKNQYFMLEHNEDAGSGGNYTINVTDNRLYAFNNSFEGVLIGVANESGNYPKIIFNITSGTETITPNTIFKSLNLAVVSNIDFDINLTTNSENNFNLRNQVSTTENESENFGFIARDIRHSVVNNINISINKLGGTSEKQINFITQNGKINNFGLFAGSAQSSSINTVSVALNTNISFAVNEQNAGQLAVGGFIGLNTDTDITSVSVLGKGNTLNVDGDNVAQITKLTVGGVIAKVQTINRNLSLREINLPTTTHADIELNINVQNTSTQTEVLVGGVVAETNIININNTYYFGSINVGEEENVIKGVSSVGGIIAKITTSGEIGFVSVNNYINQETLIVNKTDEGKLQSIKVYASNQINVGGVLGHAQNTNIKSSASAGIISNFSDIFAKSFATTTQNRNMNIGGIAGYMHNTSAGLSEISYLYNAGDIYAESNNTDVNTFVGGLVGVANNLNVLNAYSYGDVHITAVSDSSKYIVGGLLGQTSKSKIENVMVFGDVYLTSENENHNNTGILVGGLLGKAENMQESTTIGNGVVLTRLFVNEKVVVKDKNITPIAHNTSITTASNSNIYFVAEFYSQNSYGKGVAITYEALKSLLTSDSYINNIAGVSSLTISGLSKLGVEFNYENTVEKDELLALPDVKGLLSYNIIDEMLDSKLTSVGGKLNPITINSSNVSSLKADNSYYILSENITLNSQLDEFNGFLYSNNSKNVVITVNNTKAFIETNNGIIVNLLIKNTRHLTNDEAYVVNENYGVLNNVVSFGHVTDSRLLQNNINNAGLVLTNYGLIANSASSMTFTGNITGENNIYAGLVLNNEAYANITTSYVTTLFLQTENNVKVSGLVANNKENASVTHSYFAGLVNSPQSWAGLVADNKGSAVNNMFDANNINKQINSGNDAGRTENIKSENGWVKKAVNGNVLQKALVANENIAINYGYPIVLNGIKLPTNVNVTFESSNPDSNNYKKVNSMVYYSSGSANTGYTPIFSAGMLTTVNFKESNAVLISDINFNNYKQKLNDKEFGVLNSIASLEKELVGNDKTISNFYTTGRGLFATMSGGKVSNLTIEDAVIDSGYSYVGTLAGDVNGNSELTNIAVLNPAVIGLSYVGGVAGEIGEADVTINSNMIINNILVGLADESGVNINYGVIGSGSQVGGAFGSVISGSLSGEFLKNVVVENISVISTGVHEDYIAGIIGYAKNVKLSDITAIGLNVNSLQVSLVSKNVNGEYNVSETGRYIGGVIGVSFSSELSNFTITDSDISAWGWVGGVAGYLDRTALNNPSANNLNVKALAFSVGGIVGISHSSHINNSYVSHSEVVGEDYVGGILGERSVGSSINTATVSGVNIKKSSSRIDFNYLREGSRSYNVGEIFDRTGIVDTDFIYNAGKTSGLASRIGDTFPAISGDFNFGLISGNSVTTIGEISAEDSGIINTVRIIEVFFEVEINPSRIFGSWNGTVDIRLIEAVTGATAYNYYGMNGSVYWGEDLIRPSNLSEYESHRQIFYDQIKSRGINFDGHKLIYEAHSRIIFSIN